MKTVRPGMLSHSMVPLCCATNVCATNEQIVVCERAFADGQPEAPQQREALQHHRLHIGFRESVVNGRQLGLEREILGGDGETGGWHHARLFSPWPRTSSPIADAASGSGARAGRRFLSGAGRTFAWCGRISNLLWELRGVLRSDGGALLGAMRSAAP